MVLMSQKSEITFTMFDFNSHLKENNHLQFMDLQGKKRFESFQVKKERQNGKYFSEDNLGKIRTESKIIQKEGEKNLLSSKKVSKENHNRSKQKNSERLKQGRISVRMIQIFGIGKGFIIILKNRICNTIQRQQQHWNTFNNQFNFVIQLMRRRSGGVHCQTYEELIEALDSPPLHTQSPSPTFFDIDCYLNHHPSASQHSPSSYFFTEKQQFSAQEEAEISKSTHLTCFNLGLICQDVSSVFRKLTHPREVFEVFREVYESNLEYYQDLQILSHGSVISLLNIEKNFSHPQIFEKDQIKERQKMEETSQNILYQNKDNLELIIYYSQIQDKKNGRQVKFWLFKETETPFSSLLDVYLQKCSSLFKVIWSKNEEMELQELNRAAADKKNEEELSQQKTTRENLVSVLKKILGNVCQTEI